MTRLIRFFKLLIVWFLFLGCSRQNPLVIPIAQYNAELKPLPVSILNIPVNLKLSVLESIINSQLNGLLYEDKDFNDGDRMKVKVYKRNPIKLSGKDNELKYRIPLSIQVVYDAMVTNVLASGEIELEAKTSFKISKDWTLKTQTDVTNYVWIKKPVAQVVGVNIPLGSLADVILNNSKSYLGKQMDETTSSYFDLKSIVSSAWNSISRILSVSEEYKTWLSVNPSKVTMAPLIIQGDSILSNLSLMAKPQLSIGDKPRENMVNKIPDYSQVLNDNLRTLLVLRTKLPFSETKNLTLKQVGGQTFSSGKKSVTVVDVNYFGINNKLGVELTLSGVYKGKIFLTGTPQIEAKTNLINLPDLDFNLETKNFLVKSAGWILKSNLRKMIQENINFYLTLNLNETKKELEKQLNDYPLATGFKMKSRIDQLSVENIQITPEGIMVDLAIGGNLGVNTVPIVKK
ncbi:MAG: hypothetical protein RLZZ417_2641 [Bacteroidota bacterium]